MNHWDRMTEVTNGLRNLRNDEGIEFTLAERMPYTDDRIIFSDGQNISFDWSTVDAKSLCDNIRTYCNILQDRCLGFEPKDNLEELHRKILLNSRYGSLDG